VAKDSSSEKQNAAQASHPGRIACGCLARLSLHHAVRRLKPHSRRNARFWARSPSHRPTDRIRIPRLAAIAQADGSVLPWGGLSEEAATPRCPPTRMTHL